MSNVTNHEEQRYLDLLSDTLYHGHSRDDRTGVGTKSGFGAMLKFDLAKGFPLMTSRFISFRIAFEETMFFLRGQTDTKILEEKGISIWSGNTSREFLDNKGLADLPIGDMGKGYGWQIRNFGGSEVGSGFDQLVYLVNNIKNNPNDRRHYMNYWCPQQVLNEAALPPCHLSYNCQVVDDKLNACFYMRSSDLYLGLPTNIASYAFLTHMIAELVGLKVGTLVYMGADTHLYSNQFEVVEQQISKTPNPFPTFRFKKSFNTLEQALELDFSDIEIVGYNHLGRLKKVDMAI